MSFRPQIPRARQTSANTRRKPHRTSGLLFALTAVLPTSAGAEDLRVRALLEPRHEAVISADIAGRVEQLPLREGEAFKKGDILVAFDCSLYRAELTAAEAELLGADKRLANNKQLASFNSVGALEVELAEAEVAKARAEVNKRQLYVDRCQVFAPFNGRVIALKIHEHESVATGDEMLSILDDRALELRLLVPSQWLGWLRNGKNFRVQVDETGRSYRGVVTKIGARIDPVSQTLPVIGRIEDPDNRLIAGMSGTARFELTESPAKHER